MDDAEATSHCSPWKDKRWAETSAQSVDVRGALYRQPGSSSTIFWVEYPLGVLWPVCAVRRPVYRAAPEQPKRNHPDLAII